VVGHPFENGFDLTLVPQKLGEPLLWKTPRMIFVNSMSDLFHEDIPDEYILRVANVMIQANWHTYQILTKRHERLAELLKTKLRFAADNSFIWWGVSVENRKSGLPRILSLQKTPARNRFLSIEPLLEDLGKIDLDGIQWVIVGGESGPRARPLRAEWVRSIREQCRQSGVSFFFKQWGGVQKNKTGRQLDGETYDEMPVRLTVPVPPRHERLAMYANTNI
jgi:protein gp37